MIQKKSEDAVSPVIGVMLLLVVTIVLATIVAAFAGGLGTEAEPAPATAVDIVGISNGYYKEIVNVELDKNKLSADYSGWTAGKYKTNGDADGNLIDSGDYQYYYVTGDNGEKIYFARRHMDEVGNWVVETWGDRTELHDKYLKPKGEPEKVPVYDATLTLRCLHGEPLDLSKVSVKVYNNKEELVSETPRDSSKGTITPGDRAVLHINGKGIIGGNKVDVVVFYGDHKIAEAEELTVEGVLGGI